MQKQILSLIIAIICTLSANAGIVQVNDGVSFLKVETDNIGELASLLGDNANEIDSLVISGPIGENDFNTLWNASMYGKLTIINLEYASIQNDVIPNAAFFHPEIQMRFDDSGWNRIITYLPLRRIILPEGIKEIGIEAFRLSNLESINLPSSLTRIGTGCFMNCNQLEMQELIIPEGVEEIEPYTFWFCTNIKGTVKFPSSLYRIGEAAFYRSGISNLCFSEGLETIEREAFRDCINLTEVTLPSSCIDLEEMSIFSTCINLKSIKLPDGLKSIPEHFLYACIKLEKITLPESITSIEECAFYCCESLKSITIPENTNILQNEAFAYCTNLEEIILPESLNYLEKRSCSELKSLKAIYSKAYIPPTCIYDIYEGSRISPFVSSNKDCILYVPKGASPLYRASYGWSDFQKIIELDNFPTSGNIEQKVECPENNEMIYDIKGLPVSRPLKGGIYIINGKKRAFL